ncbi:hypothetical protein J6590_073631 [Homalodisca vitripennis]|nr:hypothetical protein J6590_073631 [Homalodisca vitripennis]
MMIVVTQYNAHCGSRFRAAEPRLYSSPETMNVVLVYRQGGDVTVSQTAGSASDARGNGRVWRKSFDRPVEWSCKIRRILSNWRWNATLSAGNLAQPEPMAQPHFFKEFR